MIPIAILGTVAIGFVTSCTYSIALFFSMNDVDSLLETPTGVPILALFHQAIGSKGGAIALEALIMATAIGGERYSAIPGKAACAGASLEMAEYRSPRTFARLTADLMCRFELIP